MKWYKFDPAFEQIRWTPEKPLHPTECNPRSLSFKAAKPGLPCKLVDLLSQPWNKLKRESLKPSYFSFQMIWWQGCGRAAKSISRCIIEVYWKRNVMIDKKRLPLHGLEPWISCSVGRRLVHWATAAFPPLARNTNLITSNTLKKEKGIGAILSRTALQGMTIMQRAQDRTFVFEPLYSSLS